MKTIILLWIFALLFVAKCSSFRSLDLIDLASDITDDNDNDNDITTDTDTHQSVWSKLCMISQYSLGITCILWATLIFRFFFLFKTRYEYISNLMIIFALPIFYTVLAYMSIVDKDTSGHLDVLRTFYEVILLFGVFSLMKTYVGFDAEAGIFRPDVLYEAVRRHEKVSLFSMPKPGTKQGYCGRMFTKFKKLFYFPLTTTKEARHFVDTITMTLWIFGGLRLVSLLADIIANSDDDVSIALDTIGILAMTIAIGYSYMFVHVIEKEIPQVRANRKFWSVKIFLSLTFYQGYVLELLLYYEYKVLWSEMDKNLRQELLGWVGDALICIEMVLFCFLLACVFPYSNFKDVEVLVGSKLYKAYGKQESEAPDAAKMIAADIQEDDLQKDHKPKSRLQPLDIETKPRSE